MSDHSYSPKLTEQQRRAAIAARIWGLGPSVLAEVFCVSVHTMRRLVDLKGPGYAELKQEVHRLGRIPFMMQHNDDAVFDAAEDIQARRDADKRTKLRAARRAQVEAARLSEIAQVPASWPYRRADHTLDYGLIPQDVLLDRLAMAGIETGREWAVRKCLPESEGAQAEATARAAMLEQPEAC